MVNEDIVRRIRIIETASIRNGWDFAEALERSGLLLTPQRRRSIVALEMDNLLYQLEQQQPTVFQNLGGGQATVADGARGVMEFIRMYRRMFE